MSLPQHLTELSDQADELLGVLETAAMGGFADEVMREVAEAGGLGSPEIIAAARKRWREYRGRGKPQGAVQFAQASTWRKGCDELARSMCERSKPPQLAHVALASEAIFTALGRVHSNQT